MLGAVHTIGYTKKSLADFIGRLRDAQVDCVVDVRLLNTSQLAGFAKRDDLKFLLEQGFGIGYTHIPEFAPTPELLADYKKDKDWDVYAKSYRLLIEERDMVGHFLDAANRNGWQRPCLLCAEDESDHCHRRLLAEAISANVDSVEVRHL
ncbi:MAG: hypothetical protein A2Z18_11425 [Armatimonadetes bacterium RBG_16_58_9]|nr:MAG: hypothetical protein A2Z18_11425 [Armatimonadetes bacterium RBG_16_58_9]